MARNLLLLLVSVLLTFAIGEAVARLQTPSWLYPLDPPEDALVMDDPVLGYRLRPGVALQWTREHWSNRIEIGADGYRDDPLDQARSAALRVVAVGDSFTFGIGVDHGQAWPEVLERDLAARTHETAAVVNAGVPGYSAHQMRLSALDLVEKVKPAFVVAGLYVRSYWRVNEPYAYYGGALVLSRHVPQLEIAANGDLVFTPFRSGALRELDVWLKGHLQLPARVLDRIGPRLWPDFLVPQDYPNRLLWKKPDFEPVFDELAQLHAALDARGLPLVILLVNAQLETGDFLPDEPEVNAIVAEFCEHDGVPFADPLPRFRSELHGQPVLRTPSDMHWTPLAHEMAAHEVEAVLEARGMLARR
jgi:hypothetical protein